MHRIDADGHAANLFKDAPAPATKIDAAWLNAIQAEIIAVLTAGSVAPVKGTNNQMATAIANLLAAKAAASHTHGPADIAGAFTGSLTTNGYVILPGGLILQWGRATAAANATTNIDLPIAFPTTFFAVVGGGLGQLGTDSQDNPPAVTGVVDLNTFSVFSADEVAAIFHFMAVGK